MTDISKTCQRCLKTDDSTRSRQIYTSNYEGPCGDSFCYASCDLTSCRPLHVTVCDDCTETLRKK